MAYDDGIITAPVSIHDVRKALGEGSFDLATLCSSSRINSMAKHKPVRHSSVSPLTDAQFASARYGLNASLPTFVASNTNPNAPWTYSKVVPDTNWSRLTDFDGYDHLACAPFAFDVSGALDDGVGFTIYANSMAGTYYSQKGENRRWISERSLSLSDLVVNATQQNAYLGFSIHDLTSPSGGSTAIVTNKTLGQLNQSAGSVFSIVIYPETMTISGVTYPGISMLKGTSGRAGHTFRFIAFLKQNFDGNATTHAYVQLANMSVDVYSMQFQTGVDRKEIVLNSHITIANLVCTFTGNYNVKLVKTHDSIKVKFSNGTEKTLVAYKIENGTVNANFTTPSASWAVGSVGTHVKVHNDSGYIGDYTTGIVNTDSASSVEFGYEVMLPQAGTTYPEIDIANIYARVYYEAGVSVGSRKITISGRATHVTETVNFVNTITISATS